MKKFKSALSFTLSLLMMVTMVTGVMPVFAAEYTETELATKGFDYGFDVTYNEDISYLDDDFTVYQYTRAPASYTAAAAKANNKPTDMMDSTFKAIFTNGMTGFKVYTKNGLSLATYKTKEYTDFYAEYGIGTVTQAYGFVFGGQPGNLGIVNDANTTNDTAVFVFVYSNGSAYIGGAIDPTDSTTTGTAITTAGYLTTSVLGSNVAWKAADLGGDKSTSTICVDVKDGYVTVSRKDEETYIKVKLTDAYVGGYTSLFMANHSGNGDRFTRFAIRGYDEEVVERDTVYLSATGNDGNAGDSETTAVATLARAMKLVKDGGTIHVVGEYKLDAFVQTEKAVTFVGDTLDLSGDSTVSNKHIKLLAPVTFGDITLKFHKTSYLHAQGNALEMTADVTFDGKTDVFGGTQLSSNAASSTYDTSLKLYGGTYGTVAGSHRCGLLHGDTYVEIGGTAVIANLYGGTAGDYGNVNGVATIVVNGGTITNIYGGSQNSARVSGVNITVNGGKIESVYGGGSNANVRHYTYDSTGDVANVLITLNGGTITKRVYGGCYNKDTTSFYVYGTTKVAVNNGVTLGGNAWEGMAAGSRAKTNSDAETATLDFGTSAVRRAYQQYITTGTNFIDTTDTVLPIDVAYDTVYLSATGDDNKEGNTAENAVATLEAAMELVKDGGTIHVVGEYKLDTFVETEKAVTFVGDTLDLSGDSTASNNHVKLLAPVTFGDITLKFHKTSYLHAQGHALEMTADVTFDGKTDVFGGTQLSSNAASSTYDTSLKLYGGTYGTVAGSHRCGLLHGDTYVEIGGTAVIANLYGGTAGDYGHLDGVTNIVVNGGTITNIYGGSQNSARVSGVNITVNGGTIESLYGGGNNQNIRHYTYDSTSDVATVNITLNGGTITRRVYGGSYNNTSSMKYVYGTTTIKVNGNVTFGADGVTWEGLSAGSRATANSADEISTLDFVTTANKRAYAQYITTGTNYIDTTDTVLPIDVVYDTVYLSATGDDNKEGNTAENAVATLERAYELVKDGGTINVMDTYVLDAFVETEKAVTFVGGTLDLSGQTNASGTTGWVRLYAPVTFGEITVKFKANANLLAQCNKLVVSENTTVEGTVNVFGGYQLSSVSASYTGDTHIELYAGAYTTVGGANRCGLLHGDTYVKIGGTASVTNVYGGTAGDYGNMDGEAYVYVVGGGIGNLYGGHQYSGTINGTHVFVSDGFIQNVYGGNKANNLKYTNYAANGTPATVEVVLSGGTVASRVYGGCASAAHHVFGTVSVTVTEDAILGADGFTWDGMSAGTVGTTNAAEETATLYFDSVDTQLAHSAHLVNTDTTDKVVAGDTTEEKGAVTSTAVDNGNGTKTFTFVVEAADGYEVQAGSLLAKDANGGLYVPQRVGFRTDMDDTKYMVTASSYVVLNAAFVAPTAATPNIGNIGVSINLQQGGIRFISRLAHTISADGSTATIDGQEMKLLDFGMLCGLEQVVGDNTLDIALTETNGYVLRRRVKDAGVYYDHCNGYIDMSVAIIGIANVAGGENYKVVTRAYMVVDDGSAEGLVLYADTQTSSFKDVYDYYNDSLDVVYLSKRGHDANMGDTAQTAVLTLERAYEIVKDGGTIHVVGEYPLASFVDTDKAVTFVGDTLDLSGDSTASNNHVKLLAPVTFGDITLKFHKTSYLHAQGNALEMTADVTFDGKTDVFGGTQLSSNAASSTYDTSLKLYGGTYGTVAGSHRCGLLHGDTYVEIGGTAVITNLYGGTAGDYGHLDGVTNIVVNGGTITNIYGGSQNSARVSGVNITVNDGTIESLYGGGNNQNIRHYTYDSTSDVATVNITLNGGTITRRVYGGSYNNTSSMKYVYGTTTIKVNGNVTFGADGVTWEGLSAGSRATANSTDETATLDFGDIATKLKYADYITQNATYIDTTDVVIPADYDTVYLSATGDDANAGDTAETAVATLATAMKLVKNNGTVNVVGTYAPDAFVDSAKAVTITGDTLDLTGQGDWVQLKAPVTFDAIDLKFKSGASILARGNALYITETCTVDNIINVYGGDKLAGSTYSNRYNTSLKLYAGTYNTIAGGNRIGLLHGDTYVEVGGNAGHNVGAGGHIYGGSGDAGSADFNANGAGVGGINGTTNVVVNGGNWEGVFGASQYSSKVNAVNVTINGGTIESVFGGSEVNEVKPYDETLAGTTVKVTMNGGTVTRRVYGGCYNDTVSDNRAVIGDVTLTINEGFVFSQGSWWEGIRAGSRSKDNLETENATLVFANETVKQAFSGKYGQVGTFSTTVANTTDTVLP